MPPSPTPDVGMAAVLVPVVDGAQDRLLDLRLDFEEAPGQGEGP